MKTPSMTQHMPKSEPDTSFVDEQDPLFSEVEKLLGNPCEDRQHRRRLQEFLTQHFPAFCKSHPVEERKLAVMNSIIACKTGKLGYTVTKCEDCGQVKVYPSSCGNRNCPYCGHLNELKWTALRQSEVIPGIPNFHLVFTLPHDLGALMYQNQRKTLDLLFRSVKDTILTLSRNNLKMIPGITMVLHTFGSDLSLHYHLHVLVTGGGLTEDGKGFKRCLSNHFFLPELAISRMFRGKFLDGLKQLRGDDQLLYFNDAEKYRNSYTWKELMNACYGVEWNVEIKYLAPGDSVETNGDESTGKAISYFARYTNRTAISESRVEGYDDQGIWFRYKKYDRSSYTWKTMRLEAEEFIRRFLMHILPTGMARIRYAGFMAGCIRKKRLELIYSILERDYHESPVKSMTTAELIQYFYKKDISVCDKCNGHLKVYPRLRPFIAAKPIRAA